MTRILACIIAHAAADGHHGLLRHLRRLRRRGVDQRDVGAGCISIARSRSIEFSDFIPATLKTAVFGLIIGTVASYLGFNTTQGTEGVGRTSTSSVVLVVDLHHPRSTSSLVKLIFFMFPVRA